MVQLAVERVERELSEIYTRAELEGYNELAGQFKKEADNLFDISEQV